MAIGFSSDMLENWDRNGCKRRVVLQDLYYQIMSLDKEVIYKERNSNSFLDGDEKIQCISAPSLQRLFKENGARL